MALRLRKRSPLELHNLDRRDLPSAVMPFFDGFESASLGSHWGQGDTKQWGRVRYVIV
jgi:hypothetical protein